MGICEDKHGSENLSLSFGKGILYEGGVEGLEQEEYRPLVSIRDEGRALERRRLTDHACAASAAS